MTVSRRDADFTSRGTRCAAWLYTPDGSEEPPVVVLAHGFGCERGWRLPAVAERFAEAGLAALVFDYRRFGESDGRPRNLVTPSGQVRDVRAAIEHARTLADVDGDRLALWGFSLGAGHAISAAARDDGIDAAVLTVPFSDGRETGRHLGRAGGPAYRVRSVGAALGDLARWATFRSPRYVPIAADPGAFAVFPLPGTHADFEALSGGDWDNRCPARILLTVLGYRPVERADAVDCPTLVVAAERDRVVPRGTVDRLVERLDDVELLRCPTGHFGVLTGDHSPTNVERSAAFLASHLLG